MFVPLSDVHRTVNRPLDKGERKVEFVFHGPEGDAPRCHIEKICHVCVITDRELTI